MKFRGPCEARRADEAEKIRRRRNGLETAPSNAGRPALEYLRFIIVGKVAGAWSKFGGMRAVSTDLGHMMDLRAAQNAETALRYGNAQNAVRVHLARGGGDLDLARQELARLNRYCLVDCTNDHQV